MKKHATLLAATTVAALLAGPALAQQKIKLGNLVDYTGATSSTGKFSGPGKVDAIAWINKNGGINGKMLDAEAVDYGYQTQRGIQLYKKWKDEGAVAILGYGTNDTEAMVGFIAEDKMPYFSFSFSGHLTDPSGISEKAKAGKIKPAPYNFFGQPSYSDGNRALVMWAAEDWKKKGGTGKPKYIHLGDNHPYPLAPKEAGEGIAKEMGFDVLPSIQYALGGGDFKAQCLALQSSGANYAFLANTTGSNVALVRSCSTVGVNVQFMANVWGMDEAGMKAIGKPVDGLVMVLGQPQWGSDVPGMKVFREISAMSDPTGKVYRPLPYALGACQVLHLAEGLKIADKAGQLNGPGIKAALESLKDFVPAGANGMCAPVTWTSTDHRAVDTVNIGRAAVTGDTEKGEVADLAAAGTIKLNKVAEQKVPRKPEWHGY
ncbi:MAG: ABC transporter substrate-binding protein [Hyphomicrobiaceae bacterium]